MLTLLFVIYFHLYDDAYMGISEHEVASDGMKYKMWYRSSLSPV